MTSSSIRLRTVMALGAATRLHRETIQLCKPTQSAYTDLQMTLEQPQVQALQPLMVASAPGTALMMTKRQNSSMVGCRCLYCPMEACIFGACQKLQV